jgi:hypothetical protein
MKKIFLGLALIFAGAAVNAQQQFNIGLGGGIYSTWLLNKNVFDQGEDLNVAATFGGQIGLNTQYYFNDKVGISLGILYTGNSQKYEGDFGFGVSKEARTKVRYMDIPLLLRLGGGAKGGYFEVGPQFGFLMGAKDELTITPPSGPTASGSPDHWVDIDRKDQFESLNMAIVFGFGVDIEASENIIISPGLRFGYGFTDFTKDIPALSSPLPYGAEEEHDFDYHLGTTESRAQFNQTGTGDYYKYEATHRAFGGMFITVLYKIPSKGGSKGAPVPETK